MRNNITGERLGAGAVGLLFLALFGPALAGMFGQWMEDGDNCHGLLVPLVSSYLIYTRREALRAVAPEGSRTGLAVLLGALGLFVLSLLGGVEVGQRLAFVAALNGGVLYLLGAAVYRQILFPMLFLFLMIPVPVSVINAVSFPLQIFATKASASLLLEMGLPVTRAGNLLQFPGGTLEVVEACSGVRSLLSYLTLGILFAYMGGRGIWERVFLVAAAVPIALAANVARITLSGVLGHVYGMHLARGFLHDASGFALFGLGLVVYFIVGHGLKEFRRTPAPAAGAA